MAKLLLVSLCIYYLLSTCSANMLVSMVDDTVVEIDSVQIFYRGSIMSPIQEPVTAEVTLSLENVQDRFLFILDALPIENFALQAQKAGARGIISGSYLYHVGGYIAYRINDYNAASQVEIPMVDFGVFQRTAEFFGWAQEGLIANVTMLPAEVINNPWENVMTSGWMVVWTVSTSMFSCVIIFLAIKKMIAFAKFYGGLRNALVFYVLTLEIAGNIIRILASLDTFGQNFIYPEWGAVFLSEVSTPFLLSSLLLFILYWHELMSTESVVVHPFITRLRTPFFIIAAASLAAQIIRTYLRVERVIFGSDFITALFYLTAFAFIAVFYAITGIKLLIRLRKSQSAGKRRLNNVTIRVLIGGLSVFIFDLIVIMFALGFPYGPVPFVLTWFAVYVVMDVASLMNVLAFNPSKKSASSRPTSDASNPTASNSN